MLKSVDVDHEIVAVCDGFDAATSRRVYRPTPWTPADVIREMRDNPRRGMDQVRRRTADPRRPKPTAQAV